MQAMDWKNQLTKTPYLVLFIVLITIGVGTASALITITFEGLTIFKENAQFDKDVNIDGTITGVETLEGINCSTEQIARFDGNNWVCTNENTGSDTLAGLGCNDGQIPKYVSSKMFVVGLAGDNVNEYTLSTPFDVSTASFVDSFSVTAQETGPTGLAFSSDGAKMFVVGVTGDDVNEYTLSTPFDVSTASFVDSFSVAAQEGGPRGIAFNTDGTKMFVVGAAGTDINEYTLQTAFDVSTASFVDSFSVAGQETGPEGLAFSSDGTKMFVLGTVEDAVHEYTLSTPFDVSTASFVDSFSVAGQEIGPQGLAFSSDGAKMFVVGAVGDDVNEYTLSTPFDVSTASFVDSFSVAGQEVSPTGVAFSFFEGWVCSDDP